MTDHRTDDGTDEPTAQERARRLMRREPPRFRRVQVVDIEARSPRLLRVTLGGPDLDGLEVDQPAASVRLLLPSPGTDELVMPEWDGNEFLLADGSRPAIRTFTPRRLHGGGRALDIEVVLHDGGIASDWAGGAASGDEAAISGTGRGFDIDPQTPAYVLGGDESAIPAIAQLLEAIPEEVPVDVHVEVVRPDARVDLPGHASATVTWHDLPGGARHGDALVAAIEGVDIADGAHVWVAGEAGAVQRIRKHLSGDRGLDRSRTTVRGYWKHGRDGG
jgi:NADPH-dependent ferric siderophore reductase